jgi:hypothetical protein
MTKIQEMHEQCLDFLLTHYPNLPVQLTQPNDKKGLGKGYWFPMNNKNDLFINFWNSNIYESDKLFHINLLFILNLA